MGLPASGADTSLFCSFVSSSPGPPSLCPRLPGCPRQSRPMPLFPAPSCRQARAGEALPTGPLVTSAPGRIPTLGRGREGLRRTAECAPARGLAEHPASGERKGLGEGAGEEETEGQRLGHSARCGPSGGPQPPGAPGKFRMSPPPPLPWLWDTCRVWGAWASTAPMPVPEVGVKEGTQRESPGAARTGWGTAPRRPLGGVGGVPSAGKHSQQMETRPQTLAGASGSTQLRGNPTAR